MIAFGNVLTIFVLTALMQAIIGLGHPSRAGVGPKTDAITSRIATKRKTGRCCRDDTLPAFAIDNLIEKHNFLANSINVSKMKQSKSNGTGLKRKCNWL